MQLGWNGGEARKRGDTKGLFELFPLCFIAHIKGGGGGVMYEVLSTKT